MNEEEDTDFGGYWGEATTKVDTHIPYSLDMRLKVQFTTLSFF